MSEKKVLIIDYDAGGVEALVQLLEKEGFRTVTAADGQAGWEKFQVEHPDLVILEAILPRIHGFDLTKKIVEATGGKVPVIIITALYKGTQYRHEALTTLGAADFLEKPIDPARLAARVTELLREKAEFGLNLPSPDDVINFLKKYLDQHPVN